MKQCRGQMSMFSAEASLDLASRSALPGSEEARKMTVTSGRKCSELLRNCGPVGLLVKMLLESSIWRSTRCTLTWKTKVTPSKRLLFRLVPSTPRTGGIDAPLWLGTPTAGTGTHGRSEKWRKGKTPNPQEYVMMFPTPTAAVHDLKKHNLKGVVMFYPTPTTGAGLCGGTGNFQQLKNLEARGQITPEERRSMAAGNGGQLNPDWVEWLMGFPVGWTEV